ncbi:probable Achacin at N-terminal half [Coccomyxa sp. Obi]|nr:probable Achacin at N-terminal half [Coccomyxa sp. Obi]
MERNFCACLVPLLWLCKVQGQLSGSLSGTIASPTQTPPSTCDVAIVGGGPGGIYAAYRILEGASRNGSLIVCVLEATGRVGGRVYSVRKLGEKGDLTVDMGAYRYNQERHGLVRDVVENLLKLPIRPYQASKPNLKIIVTNNGANAGFTTYVEGLLRLALDRGLNITFNARVVAINETQQGFLLELANGHVVSARSVILNLPAVPLHRLLANSNLPDRTYNPQLFAPYATTGAKVYLYYPKAWWIAQGLTDGDFIASPVWPPIKFPFGGRFYDGQVKCSPKNDSNAPTLDFTAAQASTLDLQSCYGFLQVFYEAEHTTGNFSVPYPQEFSFQPFAYFRDYADARNPDTPYFVFNNATPEGSHFLHTAHTQLVGMLKSKGTNLADNTVEDLPTQAVVALWDPSVSWAGGAWHYYKDTNDSSVANVASSVQPFPKLRLYVASEAYSVYQHWCEGTLIMAENVVRTHFNATVPAWMGQETAQRVLFGPSYNEFRGPGEP